MYKWMPVVDEMDCTGCGECIDACGPKSLALSNGVAVLALPDTCGSEEHCTPVCPEKAIRMEWLPFHGDTNRGQWTEGAQGASLGVNA